MTKERFDLLGKWGFHPAKGKQDFDFVELSPGAVLYPNKKTACDNCGQDKEIAQVLDGYCVCETCFKNPPENPREVISEFFRKKLQDV